MLTALCPCRWYEHRHGLFCLVAVAESIISGTAVDIGHLQPLTKSILWMQYNFGQGGRQMERLVNKPPSHHGRKRPKKTVVKC